MKCFRCGAENAADAVFCAGCGLALNAAEPLMEARPLPPTDLGYMPTGKAYTPPFASGHGRAVAVMVLLLLCIVTDVISAGSSFLQIELLSRPSFTRQQAETNDLREACVGLLEFVTYLATVIMYLVWLHRASRNLPALGVANQRFSPGWAVGYWFIPFVNLVRPYQVVKEIWRGSEPPAEVDSATVLPRPSSALIGWWWAMWLLNGVFGQLVIRLGLRAETSDEWITLSWCSIIGHVLDVLAAMLCLRIVQTIDRWQEAKNDYLYASVHAPGPSPLGQ
jgi:hypothetical protein